MLALILDGDSGANDVGAVEVLILINVQAQTKTECWSRSGDECVLTRHAGIDVIEGKAKAVRAVTDGDEIGVDVALCAAKRAVLKSH